MKLAYVITLTVVSLQFVCGYKLYALSSLCSNNHLRIVFDLITDNKPEVQLETGSSSAAIVTQHWNASNVHKTPACRFRVDASRFASGFDRGVYASVRRMRLRRKPGANGDCIDYVSFTRDNGLTSPLLCGDYQETDGYSGDDSRFLADESGVLYVNVRLDEKRPLMAAENLQLEIVLTAYEKNCSGVNRTVCSPGRCIAREFENDGIINCSPQRCSDEDKCVQQVPIFVQQPISGTHIAISAITSLLMTMVCVLCVYMCCKCKYDRHATPNSSVLDRSRHPHRCSRGSVEAAEFQNIELPTRSSAAAVAGGSDAASAQPITPSAPGPGGKDLPPSYESLFRKDNVISV